MADPIAVSDARVPAARNGNLGPYPYNGKLYAIALAGLSQIGEEFASVMALSSSDSGATWNYTGVQVDIGLTDNYVFGSAVSNGDQRTFAVCQHPTILNYLIVAYRGDAVGGAYEVSVFDMDAEIWWKSVV